MAVSQVWGYDCPECLQNDYGYDSEAEALRAEARHLKASPDCKDDGA